MKHVFNESSGCFENVNNLFSLSFYYSDDHCLESNFYAKSGKTNTSHGTS